MNDLEVVGPVGARRRRGERMIEPRGEGKAELFGARDEQQGRLEDAVAVAGGERRQMRLLETPVTAAFDERIDRRRRGSVDARRGRRAGRVGRACRPSCCKREEQDNNAHGKKSLN
ncbi:MAG: hypothetical protein DMF88_14535 [Acidobacteria bacterium]|nr:MAG: hypothetical protein DMF88_14535 [Acidobacteriota bacterium]